jgi:hypothetical protein
MRNAYCTGCGANGYVEFASSPGQVPYPYLCTLFLTGT